MAIQWTEQLSVGNDQIDEQHRELLERFNRLQEACRRQEGRETLEGLLTFLDEYTRTHFRDEEILMSRSGYPDWEKHRQMHREFEQKLSELQKRVAERGPSLSVIIETNQALLRWIIGHIKSEDVCLGRHLDQAAI